MSVNGTNPEYILGFCVDEALFGVRAHHIREMWAEAKVKERREIPLVYGTAGGISPQDLVEIRELFESCDNSHVETDGYKITPKPAQDDDVESNTQ